MNNRTNKPASRNGAARPKRQAPARAKQRSTINLAQLTQKAQPAKLTEPYAAARSFTQMPLDQRLKSNIRKKGYELPTEIQDKTLEHLLSGRDLMGIARTGTGKTGAFLIPLINRLISGQENFKVLILAPTRELAVQIDEEFKSLTSGMNIYSECYIGGTNINRDFQKLRRGSHFVIGTPGRLLDLYQRGALMFRDFQILILDEYDRMLDMGFARDVQRITEAMKRRQQTMLFSATVDPKQADAIGRLLRNPIEIRVSNGEATGEHIDQEIIKVAEGQDKFKVLEDMIRQPGFEKVLVFAETKRWVSKVHKKLVQSGIHAEQIHGNKSQNYRQAALKKFSNGQVQVLVATDVAARGLDVSDVSHVINYQLPSSMDSYIHRIGRTGRAGKSGKAYTFVN